MKYMNKLLHVYTVQYHTAVRINEGELLGYKTSTQCWMRKKYVAQRYVQYTIDTKF